MVLWASHTLSPGEELGDSPDYSDTILQEGLSISMNHPGMATSSSTHATLVSDNPESSLRMDSNHSTRKGLELLGAMYGPFSC